LPGEIRKSARDKVVDSIPARTRIARFWGKAQSGIGVLVANAYVNYPGVNEGDPTVLTDNTIAFYKWNGAEFIKISEGEDIGGGLYDIYNGASPTTQEWGDLLSGTDIRGMRVVDIIERGLVKYLLPTFTSFSIQSQAPTIEVGEFIPAGVKNFLWTTNNSGNVSAGSISIRDVSANRELLSGLNNDGNEPFVFDLPLFFPSPASRIFRVRASNTRGNLFERVFVVTATYKIFYASAVQAPVTSLQVRASGNVRFQNQGNTFILSTGTLHTTFYVWLPPGVNLASVVDLDALNLIITALYVPVNNFIVNDAEGKPVSGRLYVMTQTVPYTTNHRHQITIS
jgi:hypothetical protein